VPVVLYTALIFTLSSIPNLVPPGGMADADKLIHVGEYFFWGLLLRRALGRVIRAPHAFVSAVAIVSGACLAYLDESFQRTVGRQYDVYDMAADVAGVVVAQIVTDILLRRVTPGRTGPEEIKP
jgi:VanZ family protein